MAQGRPAAALDEARQATAAAISPVERELFHDRAGYAAWQCGRMQAAVDHYERSLALRRRLATPDDVRNTEIALALCQARCGQARAASHRLAELAGPGPSASAELLARASWAAALAGDPDRADQLGDAVIEHGLESGAPMDAVAPWLGEACRILDRPGDALEALGQVETRDELGFIAAVARLDLRDAGALDTAPELGPNALGQAESWCNLPVLCRALSDPEPLPGPHAEPLVAACAQRADGADAAAAARAAGW